MNGYIFICKSFRMQSRCISSNSSFFEGGTDYLIKVDEDEIFITRPDIDNARKTFKATKNKSGWVNFTITADLPLGRFDFNPTESDIDRIVISYR